MRFSLCCLFCLLTIASSVQAQQFFTVVKDTSFPVELRQTVRASKAKVGDKIEFQTLEPVLIVHGIVVPAGAKLVGEVAYAEVNRQDRPRSLLRVAVHGLIWKGGQARVNAVLCGIYYVRAAYVFRLSKGPKPTFLEHIDISAHPFAHASTDFFSDSKDVVLRAGILLNFRHIIPPDLGPDLLTASSQ